MLETFETLDVLAKEADKHSYLLNLPEHEAVMFRRIADLALSPDYLYHVSEDKLPEYEAGDGSMTLREALDILKEKGKNGKGFIGNDGKHQLSEMFGKLSTPDQTVVRLILKRNLQCGIAAKTINKVWPNTIFVKKYMRYSVLTEENKHNLKPPFHVQTKKDAKFANFVIDFKYKTLTAFSRDWYDRTENYFGTKQPNDQFFVVLQSLCPDMDGIVLHGEIGIRGSDGKFVDRAKSNGKLNSKAVGITGLGFDAWDVIPIDDFKKGVCNIAYGQRLKLLISILNSGVSFCDWKLCETWENCESLEEAAVMFNNHRASGEEGIMIKPVNGIWKDGTSTSDFKVKVVAESEFIVTGWVEGKNKHKGKVGSLIVTSDDGLVVSGIGGLSDDQRDPAYWDNAITNKLIVSAKYNDISMDEKTFQYSLSHGRLSQIRHDKEVADDLTAIKNAIKNATFL